jgi:hypothetical protein
MDNLLMVGSCHKLSLLPSVIYSMIVVIIITIIIVATTIIITLHITVPPPPLPQAVQVCVETL